jgi:hypothetical protein
MYYGYCEGDCERCDKECPVDEYLKDVLSDVDTIICDD